jgi:hypothetical protein
MDKNEVREEIAEIMQGIIDKHFLKEKDGLVRFYANPISLKNDLVDAVLALIPKHTEPEKERECTCRDGALCNYCLNKLKPLPPKKGLPEKLPLSPKGIARLQPGDEENKFIIANRINQIIDYLVERDNGKEVK